MSKQQQVSGLMDHFFRNEYGKSVAFLTNRFGPENLDMAEDAVQETLFKAMQSWPYNGIPDNPTGWIIRVAANKIIDLIRREKKIDRSADVPSEEVALQEIRDETFDDDQIRLLFACCNPTLSEENQLILTLKILGGLSVREIATCLLKKEEAVAKAFTRAKKKFKEANISLELPDPQKIDERIGSVLKVIYLLFNEGYKSTENAELIRADLCLEAMRLCEILRTNELTNRPETRALLALTCFHASRFNARTDETGAIIPLTDQDRSKWEQRLIQRGNALLASIPPTATHHEYFLQAAMSGTHCNAACFEATNWDTILNLYNRMLALRPNPIVRLNRLVPLMKVAGPEQAWKELTELETHPMLRENYLTPAFKAEILMEMNRNTEAITMLDAAITLTRNPQEKKLLTKKREKLAIRLNQPS